MGIESDDLNKAYINIDEANGYNELNLYGDIGDTYIIRHSYYRPDVLFEKIEIEGKLTSSEMLSNRDDNGINVSNSKLSSVKGTLKDGTEKIIEIPESEENNNFIICVVGGVNNEKLQIKNGNNVLYEVPFGNSQGNNSPTIEENPTSNKPSIGTSKSSYRGGGGSGGGGGGGALAYQKTQNDFNPKKENAALIKSRTVVTNLNSQNVEWKYNLDNSWSLITDKNNIAKGGYFNIIGVDTAKVSQYSSIYYFDEFGKMLTGWGKDEQGNYYLFEWVKTLEEGKMIIGWKKVNDKWYYFGLDGKLYVNMVTPDGYVVNSEGEWVNQADKV